MKIALVVAEFKNGDLIFNFNKIKEAMQRYSDLDMLCFSESFLQGFDALNWDYDHDKKIAVSLSSKYITEIKDLSKEYDMAISFGYFEKCDEKIYSSYLTINKGAIINNYRRISKHWKEYTKTDEHYSEGETVKTFVRDDKKFFIALCGDMFVCPGRFKKEGILLWPIYVNFDLESFKKMEEEYAMATKGFENVLIVNALSKDPKSYGNAFYVKDGKIIKSLGYEKEDALIVEV